jgi:predicted transporter
MRGSFREGLGRVRRAPALVAGVWASTLALALGPALVLHSQIAEHLGSSLVADAAATGVNFDWWNEFLAQASGIGQTFVPAVIGFAAVLTNLSGLADRQPLPPVLMAIVGIQLALSLFLAGGLLDRLARDRVVGASAFFSACGTWTGRFLRLALIAGPFYVFLYLHVHHWLLEHRYEDWTRDLASERQAFAVRLACYAVFTALVCAVNVVTDYAKIRAVVEDRRSMIAAFVAGARFVARHPAKTLSLYAANLACAALVAGLYFLLAPGAAAPLLAFFVGQVYIVLRVMVRLQFMASQTAFFQSQLAHAGYVAAPVPRWPDSPAAEAIGDLGA